MFQRFIKSYPQKNVKNDIFMLDNSLFLKGISELSTDLSTGTKKEGSGVQFLHPPLVQKLHPNNIKFFNKKTRVRRRAKLAKGRDLKSRSRFSRKKGGEFMDYEHLLRLKKILDCFFLECCTLTDDEGDIIEKETTFDKYSISLICKRKD